MIGLLDLNLMEKSTDTKLFHPNLEIMKLASYYQIEMEQFCRLMTLDPHQDLSNYDKIYVYAEFPAEFPDFLKGKRNVIIGGPAFTNGIYKPFEEELIDFTIPRMMIYKKFLKDARSNLMPQLEVSKFLNSAYYRMYAGEQKLPPPIINNRKRLYLYDSNIFVPDWRSILDGLCDFHPSGIYCLHPIVCRTVSEFLGIRKYTEVSRQNDVILNFPIPLNEVGVMMKAYHRKFLAEITKTSNVYLNLGLEKGTNHQYFNNLFYTLNLLYAFWNYTIPIKLKLVEPQSGQQNPIYDLSKKIVYWSNKCFDKDYDNTIIDILKLTEKESKKKPEQKQFELIMKHFPTNRKVFETCYNKIIWGRRWLL